MRTYALLEAAIGLSAYGLTLLLDQTGGFYVWLHSSLADVPAAVFVARYVFAFCVLFLPAGLMGATLPALSKFVVERQWAVGFDVGRLYALNTFGAAPGCFATGFFLIGNIGVRSTVCVAVALNFAVGGAAWFGRTLLPRGMPPQANRPEPADRGDERLSPTLRRLTLLGVAVSGLAALGYEVLWTRLLLNYLGNSIYAFATMLTTFLVGIALGSLIASRLVVHRRRLVTALGLLEAAIGLYVLVCIYLFAWFAEPLRQLQSPFPDWDQTGLRFLQAFALMLVPTSLMGAAFPVASGIYLRTLPQLGRGLGELYSWNTIGGILGAAVVGFGLMPVLGLQGAMVVLLCLNAGVGLLLCLADPAMRPLAKFSVTAALAAAFGAGLAVMPRDVLRSPPQAFAGEKIIFWKDDASATVAVTESRGDRRLLIDGLERRRHVRSVYHQPPIVGPPAHAADPAPRTANVLGFGGGGTSYAISTYPEMERIDATELCRGVAEAAPLFQAINHDVMSDPRFHLEVNDGRHFLLTTPRTYDVISVDLLYAQTAGSGSLYTREFYKLCSKRLSDDGVLVEWLQWGTIPVFDMKVILRTAQSVFPHTSLWWTRLHSHLLLVASKAPLRIDFARLTDRINMPATQQDLAQGRLSDPVAFLNCFIAADEALSHFVNGVNVINTDDLPFIEYHLPLAHGSSVLLDNIKSIAELQQSVAPLVDGMGEKDRERLASAEESMLYYYRAWIAAAEQRADAALQDSRQAVRLDPNNESARHLLDLSERVMLEQARSAGPTP